MKNNRHFDPAMYEYLSNSANYWRYMGERRNPDFPLYDAMDGNIYLEDLICLVEVRGDENRALAVREYLDLKEIACRLKFVELDVVALLDREETLIYRSCAIVVPNAEYILARGGDHYMQ